MNKQDILDILAAAAEYDKPLAIHIHITADGATVTPAPAPAPTPAGARYRVVVPADKQSGKVKLRTAPDPATGGPTVKHGEIVTLLGNPAGERRGELTFLRVEFGGEQGWIETIYLERLD